MISRNNFLHLVVDRLLKERKKRILWHLSSTIGKDELEDQERYYYKSSMWAMNKRYYLDFFTQLLTYYDFVKRNNGSEEALLSLINPIPLHVSKMNNLFSTGNFITDDILDTLQSQLTTFSALAITPLMLKYDDDHSTEETIKFLNKIGMKEGDVR